MRFACKKNEALAWRMSRRSGQRRTFGDEWNFMAIGDTRFNFDFQDFLFSDESRQNGYDAQHASECVRQLLDVWTFVTHLLLHHLKLRKVERRAKATRAVDHALVPETFASFASPCGSCIFSSPTLAVPRAWIARPERAISTLLDTARSYLDEIPIVDFFQGHVEIHDEISSARNVTSFVSRIAAKMKEVAEETKREIRSSCATLARR